MDNRCGKQNRLRAAFAEAERRECMPSAEERAWEPSPALAERMERLFEAERAQRRVTPRKFVLIAVAAVLLLIATLAVSAEVETRSGLEVTTDLSVTQFKFVKEGANTTRPTSLSYRLPAYAAPIGMMDVGFDSKAGYCSQTFQGILPFDYLMFGYFPWNFQFWMNSLEAENNRLKWKEVTVNGNEGWFFTSKSGNSLYWYSDDGYVLALASERHLSLQHMKWMASFVQRKQVKLYGLSPKWIPEGYTLAESVWNESAGSYGEGYLNEAGEMTLIFNQLVRRYSTGEWLYSAWNWQEEVEPVKVGKYNGRYYQGNGFSTLEWHVGATCYLIRSEDGADADTMIQMATHLKRIKEFPSQFEPTTQEGG